MYGYYKSNSSRIAKRTHPASNAFEIEFPCNSSADSSKLSSILTFPQSTKLIELPLHYLEKAQQEDPSRSAFYPMDMGFLTETERLERYNPLLTTITVPNNVTTSSALPSSFNQINSQIGEPSGMEDGRRRSLQLDALSQFFEHQNFNLSDDPFEPVPIGNKVFSNTHILR
jgi:hypothetical protein